MNESEVIAELLAALGPTGVITDADVAMPYRFDRAATAEPGRPLAVARPSSTAEVQATVRIAAAHRVPIVTRGAGTGLSGGSTAVDGAITLSTDRMRAVRVDTAAQLAVVQPGALNVEVKAAAAQEGLWYPPDPSSFEICSIGGNLATNAGGLCCVRYGVTTDYVLGLEVVLADGRAVRLGGRTVKDVAGYDLKRLFVGSEGTLGIVTEATLRLRPPPPPVTTVVATFSDVTDAGRAVSAVMSSMRPAAVELMDAAAGRRGRAGASDGPGRRRRVAARPVRHALSRGRSDIRPRRVIRPRRGIRRRRRAGALLRRRRSERGRGQHRRGRGRDADGRTTHGNPVRGTARHRHDRRRRRPHPRPSPTWSPRSPPSRSAPAPPSR